VTKGKELCGAFIVKMKVSILSVPFGCPLRLKVLRRCTYAGRPFGEEEFVARLEERFQRKWRRWSFESAGGAAAM